jgi:hypothetical protein
MGRQCNARVALSIFPIRDPEEIGFAIDAAQAAGATALKMLASPILHNNRKTILDRSAALRLAAIYQWPETAERVVLRPTAHASLK